MARAMAFRHMENRFRLRMGKTKPSFFAGNFARMSWATWSTVT